jgi:hypothetical protein
MSQHHVVLQRVAEQVISQLFVSTMFSPSYPLDAVKLAPNGVSYLACKGSPPATAVVHTSVWSFAAHARAVLATAPTSPEALLHTELHHGRHRLIEFAASEQV